MKVLQLTQIIPVDGDPIEKKSEFRLLSEIALALLSIPSTSVPSEVLFSKAGLIYGNKLRNQLSEQKAEECLLIKAHLCDKKDSKDILLEDEESQSGILLHPLDTSSTTDSSSTIDTSSTEHFVHHGHFIHWTLRPSWTHHPLWTLHPTKTVHPP
uniref:HAT C-terminal dimerisation domain-containing protein n=1 Tax=Acrobeloides nanus TaxID=290746 RepID=A0A914CRG6_9BILA